MKENKKKEKTLKESIADLEKLLKTQEKTLNIKAARITKMMIKAFKERLEKENG